MFDILRKIWRTGTVTKKIPFEAAPASYRGRPVLQTQGCTNCKSCAESCPTGAIELIQQHDLLEIRLDTANCIFCGLCAEHCETGTIQMTNEYRLAVKHKDDLIQSVQMFLPPSNELVTSGNKGMIR